MKISNSGPMRDPQYQPKRDTVKKSKFRTVLFADVLKKEVKKNGS